jgi:acyl-CoA synthetase (AMP-forming)/AMP-acid ligase II
MQVSTAGSAFPLHQGRDKIGRRMVACPDARWGERGLLVAVLQPGSALDRDAMVAHYTGRVAKWCIPDELVVAPELPHTTTGKLLKSMIGELYCGKRTTASF